MSVAHNLLQVSQSQSRFQHTDGIECKCNTKICIAEKVFACLCNQAYRLRMPSLIALPFPQYSFFAKMISVPRVYVTYLLV
jgi:hypothetical protein